jgi:hypothetical protein
MVFLYLHTYEPDTGWRQVKLTGHVLSDNIQGQIDADILFR